MNTEISKLEQLRELNDRLNRYRHEYFNLSAPTVSDEAYDRLLEELAALEKETGVRMTDSPTQTVGYPVVDGLDKVAHAIPLLSLEKVKQVDELVSFMGEQLILLMLKLDGLTVKLTYENGLLMEAATRGDGDVGENITHNAQSILGIRLCSRMGSRWILNAAERRVSDPGRRPFCSMKTAVNSVAARYLTDMTEHGNWNIKVGGMSRLSVSTDKSGAAQRGSLTMTRFYIAPKKLEKWMHQNGASYTGTMVEGRLLDNFVLICKRGYAAVYEHHLNCWSSDYLMEFEPGAAQEVWRRWYQFEDAEVRT